MSQNHLSPSQNHVPQSSNSLPYWIDLIDELMMDQPISSHHHHKFTALSSPTLSVSNSSLISQPSSYPHHHQHLHPHIASCSLRKALSAPQLNQLSNLRTPKKALSTHQPCSGSSTSLLLPETAELMSSNSCFPPSSYLSSANGQQPDKSTMMQPIHQRSASLHLLPRLEGKDPAETEEQRYLNIFPINSFGGRRIPEETQDSDLHLVHLLVFCANAVAAKDYVTAKHSILQLQQRVSVNGSSTQRVAAYFTYALRSRLLGTGSKFRRFDPASSEVSVAYHMLYQVSPYIKFAHLISNQAIFEAFEGEDKVHIIDLDILQGYQWPAFLQALAARPGRSPHVRITGIGRSVGGVEETGKRLCEVAESLHVPFEFHPVAEKLENITSSMLHRRIGEALAVNSINRLNNLLSQSLTPLLGTLRMIREQAPKVFTIVEQESSHNTSSSFLRTFLEALHFYSAIFDSLNATMLPENSQHRTRIERTIFGQEISNIIACQLPETLQRHEKLEQWRKTMEAIGFASVNFSANAVNQSKLLLGLYSSDEFTLQEDNGCVLLGWQDQPIFAASAWQC